MRNSKDITKVSNYQTYIGPHLKSRRINFVELIEVAVHDGVFRQAVLGACCYYNCTQYLLTSGSFVTDLKRGEKVVQRNIEFKGTEHTVSLKLIVKTRPFEHV